MYFLGIIHIGNYKLPWIFGYIGLNHSDIFITTEVTSLNRPVSKREMGEYPFVRNDIVNVNVSLSIGCMNNFSASCFIDQMLWAAAALKRAGKLSI